MISILRQYIEGDMNVIEYTKDGVTVSHVVKTPVQNETAGEQLPPLPPNPLLQLQQENQQLKQQLAQINGDFVAFMDFYFSNTTA
ncbi:hypothetical protein [Anoxybacillus sp. EFIL]|uniref:hypothetical protein n=1 Tax=Anoxybacillus sp. EFIL TaxID=2508869 RepID=UPI00148C202B|nr:hypothetical protein [Anoxybacillus sp. EFIL]NNU96163.1 hypothetical protein [Anoxybacillus sp. EFIL]